MMNILVVCQYYHPEPFRLTDICESLVKEGHAVTVVTGTPNYPEGKIYPGYENKARQEEIVNGVRVHRCPLIPRGNSKFTLFFNYYSFVFSSRRYLDRLQEDYDVVFVYQISPVMMAEGALAWAKKHHKKCVLYCLDLWPESLTIGGISKNSPIYHLYRHISRNIYQKADEILVSTRSFIRYFGDILKMGGAKIVYRPQYAEELYDDVPPVSTHEGPYNFMFAGNIGHGQSIETIIEAVKILKDDSRIFFHMVGGGSSLSQCQEMTKGCRNIKFYGRHPVEEMPSFYQMADVMMVSIPANPNIDTVQSKMQSYLAAGRAVVGAVNGEMARIIDESNCGCRVPAEDAERLAQAIQKMVEHPELFRVYGENGRRYYRKEFRKDVFISELISTLEKNC